MAEITNRKNFLICHFVSEGYADKRETSMV